MLIPVLGFMVLAGVTFTLFGFGFAETFNYTGRIGISVVSFIILAAMFYGAKLECSASLAKEKMKSVKYDNKDLENFIAVVAGAMISYFINVKLGLGGVVAAGLVGVAAALVLPKHDVPTYCGSFVGMASAALLPTYYHVLLAAVIAGAVYVMTKSVFNGFGGKLGTTAVTGCVFAALLTGNKLGSAPVPAGDVVLLYAFYSALGAVLSYGVKERFKHNAVISSGLIVLLGGLLLPALNPQMGGALAVVTACGAFAGMSAPARVANVFNMAVAGVFCALIFAYTAPYFGGAGGKLGTIAFGSVISLYGMLNLIKTFTSKKAAGYPQSPGQAK